MFDKRGDSMNANTFSRWKQSLLSAAMIITGPVLGVVLFLFIWLVPSLRNAASVLVLSVPRVVEVLIVIGIVLGAGIALWFARASLLPEAEEEGEQDRRGPVVNVLLEQEPWAAQPATRQDVSSPVPKAHHDLMMALPATVIAPAASPQAAIPLAPARREGGEQVGPGATPSSKRWRIAPTTLISITLLKELTLTLHLPDGSTRPVPINAGTTRARLLAYLAVRRGELVKSEKIIHHVIGWRLEDGTADDQVLRERFHSHVRLLRDQISKVVREINQEAGEDPLPARLDPFVIDNESWGLSPICQVVDLEEVEQQYKLIEPFKSSSTQDLPVFVKEACERLLEAYPGDFIEDQIKFPGDPLLISAISTLLGYGKDSFLEQPYEPLKSQEPFLHFIFNH